MSDTAPLPSQEEPVIASRLRLLEQALRELQPVVRASCDMHANQVMDAAIGSFLDIRDHYSSASLPRSESADVDRIVATLEGLPTAEDARKPLALRITQAIAMLKRLPARSPESPPEPFEDAGAIYARMSLVERKLREMLWLGHGCMGLYGDDGEMHCGACSRDFLRDAIGGLMELYEAKRLERMSRASLRSETEPTESRECICGHGRGKHRADEWMDEWYDCTADHCPCEGFVPVAESTPSVSGTTPSETRRYEGRPDPMPAGTPAPWIYDRVNAWFAEQPQRQIAELVRDCIAEERTRRDRP